MSVITEEALLNVLPSIERNSAMRTRPAFEKVADQPCIVRALEAAQGGNIRDFHRVLVRPFNELVDVVLDTALQDNGRAHFLIKHADFLRFQLQELFERIEGSSFCSDKTNWVMSQLMRHFLENEPMTVKPVDVGAYYVPSRILQDEESLLGAFNALRQLYHGKVFYYMDWVSRLAKSLKPAGTAATGNDDAASPKLRATVTYPSAEGPAATATAATAATATAGANRHHAYHRVEDAESEEARTEDEGADDASRRLVTSSSFDTAPPRRYLH